MHLSRLPRLAPLVLLGLLGCPEEAELDGEPTGGTDSGGGDTGGATGPTASARDGRYAGEIIIVGSIVDGTVEGGAEAGSGGETGQAETCVGTLALSVAADAEPEIDGLATCAFAGWLEWLGPQELTVTGGSLGAQGAEGTVATTIEGARFDEIWTGAWEGDQLAGSFSGEVALALGGRDYELRYEGSFTAHRVP